MRFGLTLMQKYTLVSALCVLALVLGLGTLVARQLNQRMLARDGQLTAEFVQAQVREHLTAADFKAGVPDAFTRVFREISKIPELLQVNVFDPAGTIIWSSEPALIGRRFPGKRDLQEALAGRLVTGVAEETPEQLRRPGAPDRLVELYLPLTGWGDRVDPELLRESGVVRALAKPVEMKDLFRILSEAMRPGGES